MKSKIENKNENKNKSYNENGYKKMKMKIVFGFVTSLWPSGVMDRQLSLPWRRTVKAFWLKTFAHGLVVP